jgi:hypothetical protein
LTLPTDPVPIFIIFGLTSLINIFLGKKGSGLPTKRTAENIEEVE